MHTWSQPPRWLFGAWLLLAVWLATREPPQLRGDGREYILQTQAIALRGALAIDTAAARTYWNRTNPFGVELEATRPPARELREEYQAGGGFGGLYPDRCGNYRFCHFWGYSLAVAPLYGLLHLAGRGAAEYHAFRWMNLFFFLLPFWLAWRRAPRWPVLAVSLLALATPLPAYVSWPHPELFCFGLTTAALLLAAQPRARLVSALLLAVSATQNLPLLLFFPLHLLVALQRRWPSTWRQCVPLAASYLPAVLLVAATLLWTHHCFGVFNVITGAGMARGSYASWTGVAAICGGPLIGALWYYPMCFLLLPAGARRSDAALLAATALAVAAAAWLCTTTANFNSDQAGAWRYTAWLLATCWFLLLTPAAPVRRLLLVGGLAASLAITGLHHLGGFSRSRARQDQQHWRAAAALYRTLHWSDDLEVLAETIMGCELAVPSAFDGVYVWNLGPRDAVWLVSRRWADANPAELDKVAPGAVWRRHPIYGDFLLVWRQETTRALACVGPVYIVDAAGHPLPPAPRP